LIGKKSNDNLYSGVSDKSLQGRCTTATTGENDAGVAPVGRQPQGLPIMAASIPNTAPVVHLTPSRSQYQFILSPAISEQFYRMLRCLDGSAQHIM